MHILYKEIIYMCLYKYINMYKSVTVNYLL